MRKFDLEAKLYIDILKLKEIKKKKYSDDCETNCAYVFDSYDNFRNYFLENGCKFGYDDEIISQCKMKTTKRGSIIALKKLCDHVIAMDKQTNMNPDEDLVPMQPKKLLNIKREN